jgi:Alternative splicing regulator
MAPPRSDKKRGREDASLAGPGELYVLGVPATIHTAGAVCAEELLHSWAGDVCVTIDRFDVRSLLDSWTPPPPERCWHACREAQGDVALDEERYGDLLVAEQKEQVVEKEDTGALPPVLFLCPSLPATPSSLHLLVPDEAAVASGAFNAVGFAYALATQDGSGDAAPLPPPPPPPPPAAAAAGALCATIRATGA